MPINYEDPQTRIMLLFVLAFFGVAAWWGLLRLMDIAAGLSFRDTIDRIENDPKAAALYFGLRACAVAYLICGLFSRFV